MHYNLLICDIKNLYISQMYLKIKKLRLLKLPTCSKWLNEMSSVPDFPEWFIYLLIISALIGLITIVISIISGIVWLCNHVTIA